MRNPYITDRPLTNQDLYYGHAPEFDQIKGYLNAGRRLLLLYGRPQIGKTSFVNQLESRLGGPHRVHIASWLSGSARSPLFQMVDIMSRAVQDAESVAALPPTTTTAEMQRRVASLAAVESETVHLICIDAIQVAEFQRSNGWQEALTALELMLEPDGHLALLIIVSGIAQQSDVEPGQISHLALENLTALETEDALMQPVRGQMTFDLDAVRQVHRYSGGEPYFVQQFGHALFEARSRRGWVDVPEVTNALESVMARSRPRFEARWEAFGSACQIVLCVFSQRIGTDGIVTTDEIDVLLRQQRVIVPERDLASAVQRLVDFRVLERLGGQTLRFVNTLFLGWIKQEQDLVQTVQQAEDYAREREKRPSAWPGRRPDWLAILLWLLAGALVVVIAWVWRSRELSVFWTSEPPEALTPTQLEPTKPLPTPQQGVSPGRIVYMSKAEPADLWAIFVMRSDGSDPTRLTENEANDTAPVLSPDGRRIVFVSDRDGNREIYVMNADGNAQLNLTQDGAEDFAPCWSPDGAQIAFSSFRNENWEIYVMDADGGNPQRLTSHAAADYAPAWSPDGERIAFVSDRQGDLDIFTMAVDGSDVQQFTKDKGTDQSPGWSPDGDQIIWESFRDDNMEIYAANADGSNLRNVSQDAFANDHGASWSPWGSGVIYYTNRDTGWDIMLLDMESGLRTNLTQSAELEQAPNWGR